MVCPCYQCKDRAERCHSTCASYLEFRKAIEKNRKDKYKNISFFEYRTDTKTRLVKQIQKGQKR